MTKDISEKYELGAPIAEGGQGLLRRARRIEDGLEVVVKKYSQMTDAKSWDSYEEGEVGAARELAFLRRANNESIEGVPKLLEYGETGSWKEPIAVFEPIPGRTIEDEVSALDYNPSSERIRWFFDKVRAPLEYAHHSNGVKPTVHRDLKPENVMINGKSVVVMDWAAATPTSGKTYHGKTRVLSLYYTAPEVLAGSPFDQRADIYSLGKILQLMFLGKNLFWETEGMPSRKDFEKLNIPEGIAGVLEKATSEKQEQRYRTIREFHDAFEKAYRIVRTNVPARNTGHVSVSESFRPLSLIKTPEFSEAVIVGGNLGEKFMEIYAEKARELGNPKVLDVLKLNRKFFKPWQRVVKGGNSFSGVLANQALRELGYRAVTRPDLEKILAGKMLDLGLNYVDFGVALTHAGDSHAPNDLLAKKLAQQLKHRGISLGIGKLFGFNALSLEKNPESTYGLVYNLRDEATEDDILDLNSFKWDYNREGLSGAFLGWLRCWGADRYLEGSYGDGRVVAVSGGATRDNLGVDTAAEEDMD